jgi:hypothetical protein
MPATKKRVSVYPSEIILSGGLLGAGVGVISAWLRHSWIEGAAAIVIGAVFVIIGLIVEGYEH